MESYVAYWRCALIEDGQLYVGMDGPIILMLLLYVESWDILMVRHAVSS